MANWGYQAAVDVIDFATRYYDELNTIVGNRMRQLGVPDDMIGIKNFPGIDEGPFVRFPNTQIGGNINPYIMPNSLAGIALDHGIFDAAHPRMRNVPSWGIATLKDRMDAAIVHEFLESTGKPPPHLSGDPAVEWQHQEAIKQGPDTKLPIMLGARQILIEYRNAEE